MNISRSKIFSFLIFMFLALGTGIASATLGNNPQENEVIYGQESQKPKYHFKGQKSAVIYLKDNAIVTVIYRDGFSILENISYSKPVENSLAEKDMKELMLPKSNNKACFTNTMPFGDAYFKENIYKEGMKTKVIFDSKDNVKEIISSLDKIKNKLDTNEEE